MTEQLKAEAWVRSQRPALLELSFGCDVIVAGIREDNPGCENDVVVDSRKDEHGRIGLGYFGYVHPDDFKTIGHPIQLNDWLAVLGHWYWVDGIGDVWKTQGVGSNTLRLKWKFNMETGQPFRKADYKYFNKIVGV